MAHQTCILLFYSPGRYFYIVRDEISSLWSSCRCAGLGVLVQGRYGDTLGGIRGRHWGDRVGFRSGCTARLCARGLVHWSRVRQISFWCLAIVFRASDRWGLVSACAGVFRCGWCGCSWVDLGALGVILGVFLVHCVLCCVGGSDSAR